MKKKKQDRTSTVLYIHAGEDLVRLVNAELQKQREQNPNRSISKSDLIRETLWAALYRKGLMQNDILAEETKV